MRKENCGRIPEQRLFINTLISSSLENTFENVVLKYYDPSKKSLKFKDFFV